MLAVLPVSGALLAPPPWPTAAFFLGMCVAVTVVVAPLLIAPEPNEDTSDVLTPLAFFSVSRNLGAATERHVTEHVG